MRWYEGKIQSATIIRKINYVFDAGVPPSLRVGNGCTSGLGRLKRPPRIWVRLDKRESAAVA